MKNYVVSLLVLLSVLFIPTSVFAKEYCKVVSGDGKSIGSEIACGTEHFYIVDSTDEELRLLSKYNLYTGSSVFKEEIVKESTDTRTDEQYCQELAASKEGTLKTGGVYDVPGYCFVEIEIQADEMKQRSDALSAHWDADENYLYPQVGDVYLKDGVEPIPTSPYAATDVSDFIENSSTKEKYDNFFYDYYITEGKNVSSIINSYKNTLSANDFEVNDIDLLTLDDINTIIKSNDKSITYGEWYGYATTIGRVNNFGEFVFLQDYLNDKQSFLYNTTYWIRSGYTSSSSYNVSNNDYRNVLFIDSKGGVCESGFAISGTAVICGATVYSYLTTLGCGIRPVITIPNELMYLIKTKTDGNGTIEVIDNSLGGEVISFRINAKSGYNLTKLIITTDSGETVEFEEGEILGESDDIVSIDGNKFTMPFENVTIEASWKAEGEDTVEVETETETEQKVVDNPQTDDKIIPYMLTLLLSLSGLCGALLLFKKKEV
ncbi:hypothetical protein J6Z48_01025 [bacterium]|nr:hypothetical protein [bacterium]